MKLHFLSKDEFIEYVTQDCLNQLSEEQKNKIRNNPDPFLLHFGLGMHIRNHYIYGNNQIAFDPPHPDDLSSEIVDRMVDILSSQENT